MRGAVDGLAAVPPYGDPAYARLRGSLAIAAPGATDGALRLDNLFGLHPQLTFLHESFAAGELAVFHAVATRVPRSLPFRWPGCAGERRARAACLADRLVEPRAGDAAEAGGQRPSAASRLGSNVPLMMRGPAPVASWAPTKLAELDEDTLQRIADLYSHDPHAGPAAG